MGLKNIAAETHENLPPSRPQSKKTIDFILGTSGVLDSVLCLSMVPYDLENLGDHRGIIMDLDLEMLLGRNTQHKQQFSQRKLRTSDVKACESYMDKLEEKFTYHNIYERTKRLVAELDIKGRATKYLLKQYNSLHTDIHRSCKHAEKNCRKACLGEHYWSPKLDHAINVRRYWKMRVTRAQTSEPPTYQMKQYKKKYDIQDEYEDIQCIKAKVQDAN